ncbi:hypothetical protein ACKF11_13250 [Methylobacillus sp. Pita2]|uniref:hypothetical protein n=1 Tax=Methylobacillus sp. Pita2 TaxID=3383245 RepID=UPI0038B4BAB9
MKRLLMAIAAIALGTGSTIVVAEEKPSLLQPPKFYTYDNDGSPNGYILMLHTCQKVNGQPTLAIDPTIYQHAVMVPKEGMQKLQTAVDGIAEEALSQNDEYKKSFAKIAQFEDEGKIDGMRYWQQKRANIKSEVTAALTFNFFSKFAQGMVEKPDNKAPFYHTRGIHDPVRAASFEELVAKTNNDCIKGIPLFKKPN